MEIKGKLCLKSWARWKKNRIEFRQSRELSFAPQLSPNTIRRTFRHRIIADDHKNITQQRNLRHRANAPQKSYDFVEY